MESIYDQNTVWYNTNRQNYQQSVTTHYPASLYGNTNMHFLPHDMTQYGTIHRVVTGGTGMAANLWLLKIPAGLYVYHASRSLAVNNGEFPLTYNINDTPEKNKEREEQRIANLQGTIPEGTVKCYHYVDFFPWCIANTYYASTPIDEYLHKSSDKDRLGRQIRYSYGLDVKNPAPTMNSMTKQQYNDRIAGEANIHELGYAAYKLKRDTYFVAMPDEFFINRGRHGVLLLNA